MSHQAASQDQNTITGFSSGSGVGPGATALRRLILSAQESNDALDRLVLRLTAHVGRLSDLPSVLPYLAPGSDPIADAKRTAYTVELEKEWHDNTLGSLVGMTQSVFVDDAERAELEASVRSLMARARARAGAGGTGLQSLVDAARQRASSAGRVLDWQDVRFPEADTRVWEEFDVAFDEVLRVSSAPWPSREGSEWRIGQARGSVIDVDNAELQQARNSAPWPGSGGAAATSTGTDSGTRTDPECKPAQNSAPWPAATASN